MGSDPNTADAGTARCDLTLARGGEKLVPRRSKAASCREQSLGLALLRFLVLSLLILLGLSKI
jgi:hypothetical protein